MSATPETNALLKQRGIKGRNPDPWKLCRKLERERDEAEKDAETLQASNNTYERDWPQLVHERNQWRECAERLAAALKLEASHPDSGCRRVGTTDALAEFGRLKESSK